MNRIPKHQPNNHTRSLRSRLEDGKITLFLLPSLIGFLAFYIVPFIISLYLALINNNAAKQFVGLKNFMDVIRNDAFRLAIRNTLQFIAICVPLNMILPLLMAMVANRMGKTLKKIMVLVFLLPLVIPSGSMVFFWKSIFGLNGILNKLFFTQNPVNWLDTDFALAIIILIFIWKNAGYNMILFMTGLSQIPREYYEYASLEGAGSFRLFSRVTLVYIMPTTFMVFVMSVINSFKAFKEIYLLSGAYPHQSIYMLQHYMNNLFSALNYQRLASASYLVFAVILLLVIALFRFQNRFSYK